MVLARYMETQIWCTCRLCVGRTQQRYSGACWHFNPWRAALPALALKPDNSFSPHMSWSFSRCCTFAGASDECLWVSKSVLGPFKRTLVCAAALRLTWCSLCWFLQPGVVGTSLPSTGALRWGALCRTGTPWSLGELLQPRNPSWFLTTAACGFGTSPFASVTLLPVLTWLLLYVLSYTTSLQLVFRQISGIVVL